MATPDRSETTERPGASPDIEHALGDVRAALDRLGGALDEAAERTWASTKAEARAGIAELDQTLDAMGRRLRQEVERIGEPFDRNRPVDESPAAPATDGAAITRPARPRGDRGSRPLSGDRGLPNFASAAGSGSFGRWIVDRFGLPAYRYDLDHTSAPQAVQPALRGRRDAWNNVGNDRIKADAHVSGHAQFWSQERLPQWANAYDEEGGCFAGGYGYLRLAGTTHSTLYEDRPADAEVYRAFGIGYFEHRTEWEGLAVEEVTYAPFGDHPLILRDVTIANPTTQPVDAVWWEYWDLNPIVLAPNDDPASGGNRFRRGLEPTAYDPARAILSATLLPFAQDDQPLSIFAAPIAGPFAGFEASRAVFFGDGSRARPAAVATDQASGSTGPASANGEASNALFALRSPVRLEPGARIQLRYAFGMASSTAIGEIVDAWRSRPDPLVESMAAWTEWLPRFEFGPSLRWLNRELVWSAYMVRANAMRDPAGRIITQGGYYQFAQGTQSGFHDPLQHALPMIYAQPSLAREVIAYSLARQHPDGYVAYGVAGLAEDWDTNGNNNGDGFWLLFLTDEYVRTTRDFAFLDEIVPYQGGTPATVWDHLKLGFRHQESFFGGPHGLYKPGTFGDENDVAVEFLGLTESTFTTQMVAFGYPRFAELADAHGDAAFAAELRQAGARAAASCRREWQDRGWFSRGYAGDRRLGEAVIYGEAQPWGILANVLTVEQHQQLVANIRRFLTGHGAPPALGGPSPIGSSASPASADPEVAEQSETEVRVWGPESAVFLDGVWWFIDGPLAWALASLADAIPAARAFAWDEFTRLTLHAHATAFPDRWSGIIASDDTCAPFFSPQRGLTGFGFMTQFNQSYVTDYFTQITHPHAWVLTLALKLAGIEPSMRGYRIAPRYPVGTFSLRLPVLGVSYEADRVRGYFTGERDETLCFEVAPAEGWASPPTDLQVLVRGKPAPHEVTDAGLVAFELPARKGEATDWEVVAGSGV